MMFLKRPLTYFLFPVLLLTASTSLLATPAAEKNATSEKPRSSNATGGDKKERSLKGSSDTGENKKPAPVVPKKKTEEPSSLSGTFAIVNSVDNSPETRALLLGLYSLAKPGFLGTPPEGDALKKALLASPHDKIAAKATASLKRGRVLYAALKLSQAVTRFEKAKALFLRHVPRQEAIPSLVSTLSYLLLSYNSLGMQNKTQGTALTLSLLTGGKRPAKIPAPLWSRLRPAKKRNKTRVLSIQAPKGSSVYVDFATPINPKKKEGEEDVTWTLSVSPRSHHVTVEAPGQQKFYKEVSAGKGQASVVAVMVSAAKDPYPKIRARVASALSGEPLDTKQLAILSRRARVQRLLVAKKGQPGVFLQVYEAKKDKLLEPKLPLSRLDAKKAESAMTKWAATVASRLRHKKKKLPLKESARKAATRVTKKSPLKNKKKKKKATPIWKRWYFWVALGAVGVVTAVFALKEDPSNKVEIQVHRP